MRREAGVDATDLSDTRERLLDAAERLFAEHGFAAASVRDITRAAGCNLAAVNYHFGGKLNLYEQVFRRRLTALRTARVERVARASGAHAADLERVLSSFAEAFLEPILNTGGSHAWVQLISRELVDPQLPPAVFLAEMVVPVQRALIAAIARVAPDLDRGVLRLGVTSFIGQLTHVLHVRRYAAQPFAATVYPDSPAALVRHIVAFTAAGMRGLSSAAGPPLDEEERA